MASKKPNLTISLLSSGRSNTIERCLKSLAPFKEQLHTEIIVVDTDPEHNPDVHAILEQYVDKIIPFTWCDDFAAARNAGLKAARGAWFMFVDDDEWFTDAQPLIDFFKSGDSRKFRWGNYRIRNYLSENWEKYQDSWATRFFLNDGKTKFVGRVHECPAPVVGKAKNIPAKAGHTGYIYHTREEKLEHSRRNMVLLEKLTEEDPKQGRWWLQLLIEHDNLRNIEKQREINEHALNVLKGQTGAYPRIIRGCLSANALRIELAQSDYKRCDELYEELHHSKEARTDVSDAAMELLEAQALVRLERFTEAGQHAANYMEYYDRLAEQRDEFGEECPYFLIETFERKWWVPAVSILISCGIREGSWEAFDQYFEELCADDSKDVPAFARDILGAASATDYDPRMRRIAASLWMTEAGRAAIRRFLSGSGFGENNGKLNIVRAVAESGINDPNPWDILLIWADHTGGDKDSIVNAMPLGRFRRQIDAFIKEQEPDSVTRQLKIFSDMGNLTRAIYARYVMRRHIISHVNKTDRGSLKKMFAAFARDCIVYHAAYIQPDKIKEQSVFLPDPMGLALRLQQALAIPENDYRAVLAAFKDMIGIDPPMDGALKIYSHLYAKDAKQLATEADKSNILMTKDYNPIEQDTADTGRKTIEQQDVQSEMQQLIDSIQNKVRELIDAGMTDEAEKVMGEIRKYSP
ncbi:MAG: glycosyltransferase [Lachnospiraceae bacterium]|nr:glycosyltransferase [Lachnospiraceae bacterium]